MQTAGIIGGAGFIGSYMTRQFLENGFRVRVSATDIRDLDKYAHLSRLPNAEHLELVSLDVQDKEQLQRFIEGCDLIVHGGTPFRMEVEDAHRDLFAPTVDGTLNLLEAAARFPSVKKVVFIASAASINTNFPMPADGRGPDHVYTEQDEPFISTESLPYAQAKFHADQAVRKYVQEHPDCDFEIVTLMPVMVVGEQLSARTDSTSMGFRHLFRHKIAPTPLFQMIYDMDAGFPLVHVEDVADAAFRAATHAGLHGRHYLISKETWRVSDVSRMLNNQEPLGLPVVRVSGELSSRELGLHYKPVAEALGGA